MRRRLSGSVRESTAARAATELPPMTAIVVPSKVGAVAEERGGMANVVVVMVMGLIVVVVVSFGGAFGENAGGFGWWVWKPSGEESEAEKAIVFGGLEVGDGDTVRV